MPGGIPASIILLEFEFPFNPRQEPGEGDVETFGHREQRLNSKVVLTAFNSTHIGSVKPAMIGEAFLRKFLPPTKLADSTAKGRLELLHAQQFGWATTMTLVLVISASISSADPQASGTATKKASGTAAASPKASAPVSSVSGKTYVDEEGNTIAFHAQGKATETNGRVGSMYPHQSAVFGNNGRAVSECTYSQTGSKVNLSCEAAEEMKLVYTVNKDGSLTGPLEGMYGHASFAHLTEKSKN